jgi:hypothetical protein
MSNDGIIKTNSKKSSLNKKQSIDKDSEWNNEKQSLLVNNISFK